MPDRPSVLWRCQKCGGAAYETPLDRKGEGLLYCRSCDWWTPYRYSEQPEGEWTDSADGWLDMRLMFEDED